MFKISRENGRVIVTRPDGTAEHIEFENYIKAEWVVARFTDIFLPKGPVRKRVKLLKEAGDVLGCIPSQFARMLRGAMWQEYVLPHKKYIFRYALQHKQKSIDTTLMYKVIDRYKIMEQYEADGNKHLVAYGLLIGDAKKAKETLGKGTWKTLCKTAASRNDLIARHAYKIAQGGRQTDNIDLLTRLIKELVKIPTTFLAQGTDALPIVLYGDIVLSIFDKIKAVTPKPYIEWDSNMIQGTINTIEGVLVMAREVGVEVDLSWSIRRFIQEHTHILQRRITMRYPSTPFDSLANIPKEIKDEEFTATLLDNPYALHMEGTRQHHCVAAYSDKVATGEYVVYSITDGITISTIGIPAKGSHLTHQHYGACNSQVTNEARIKFASKLFNTTRALLTPRNEPHYGAPLPIGELQLDIDI